MQTEPVILQARLKNCLLTIVELEPVLTKFTIHSELLQEFKHLRSVISKVSELELSMEEVARIESATSMFLNELEIPLSYLNIKRDQTLQ